MDATDVKDMFLDVVGGTSLDEATVDRLFTEGLALLDQLTAHQGVNFMETNPLLVVQSMQYYYGLLQHNAAGAKEDLAALTTIVTQLNNDFIQVEQADWPNYMGDR